MPFGDDGTLRGLNSATLVPGTLGMIAHTILELQSNVHLRVESEQIVCAGRPWCRLFEPTCHQFVAAVQRACQDWSCRRGTLR